MLLNDNLIATGRLRIVVVDALGRVKSDDEYDNLVVDAGKAWLAARGLDDANIPAQMSHMALGAGTAAPAGADTALGSELGRVALDSITNSGNTTTYQATFGPGTATGAVTEAGIFNAATGGTMLSRLTFPVKNKGDLDTIYATWNITIN